MNDTLDTKYSLFLYQADKIKAFSVGFMTYENETFTREQVKGCCERMILEILEGLKKMDIIDEYDIGVNDKTWKAIK